MYFKIWENLRSFVEQIRLVGISAHAMESSDYDDCEPATDTYLTRTDNDTIYRQFDYINIGFECRSAAFEEVWESIDAGAYQEYFSAMPMIDHSDIATIREKLRPLQYFCQAILEQVRLSDDWTAVLSPVTPGDGETIIGKSTFVNYLLELVPCNPELISGYEISRIYGNRTNWPMYPSRPPVPAGGVRIPILACVFNREGSCPPYIINAEDIQNMASWRDIYGSPDFNGLRAIVHTSRIVQNYHIPQVWFGDSKYWYRFDYSECSLKKEHQGYRGTVEISPCHAHLHPTKPMAQECFETIIRMLPQWRVPYALWETNEFAPYPNWSYMKPPNAIRCTTCPKPFDRSIRAWSQEACLDCGGWGYSYHNKQTAQTELYWKPPAGRRWNLPWTATHTADVSGSPALVGQTLDGNRPSK